MEDNQYLPEDKDILDELDAMGPATGAPVIASQKMQELASLQIKATLRNRKTAHDLDRSTSRYSLALIAFALAQLALGVFEFLFDAEFSGHVAVGIGYVVLTTILIVYIIGTAIKEINKS
jgi:hypothetical protein